MRDRIVHILFWSVLSAAFIGPGTITAAASAGSGYGFTLLWALLFSTIACIVLQEAGSRLSVSGGQNLGESIVQRFRGGPLGNAVIFGVGGSILLGCAAYEAGNILGGVAGLRLVTDAPTALLALALGTGAFLLLWFGSTRLIAQLLGVVVALMGVCFLTTAVIMEPAPGELLRGAFVPSIPDGSELLVIGLIGTTVVPYNLFLGSAIKHTQSLKEMRLSLALAILLGGVVSMGVLVVGSSVAGSFTYEGLSASLGETLGGWAALFFAAGLAAAGLSSALTAPLAGALTARSLWGTGEDPRWADRGSRFRAVWGAILLTGILFGVSQVRPIPAIILAQALNGIILPFIAVFLLLMANDASLLGRQINGAGANLLTAAIVYVTLILGITNLVRALSRATGITLVQESYILLAASVLGLLLAFPIGRTLMRYRRE